MPIIKRSEKNKILGGVCGGIGEYFNIDPSIIRLIFILLAVFGGSGFFIYVILWMILPPKSQINLQEMRDKVKEFTGNNKQDSKYLFALIAILLGIIFLLQNFGFGDLFNLSKLWPLILIAIGISFLLKNK